MTWKLKYFGLFEHYSSLGRIVLDGVAPGGRDRDQPAHRQAQDIKQTLCMKVHEVGELAKKSRIS